MLISLISNPKYLSSFKNTLKYSFPDGISKDFADL